MSRSGGDRSRRDPAGPRSLMVGLALLATMALSACGFGRGGPSESERRAPCDSLAAQAIDAEDLGEARRLAARASDCYSGLQSR